MTTMTRFTISITKDMEEKLDLLKQAKYYNDTRNKMVQDLICIGLETMQTEIESIGKIRNSTDTRADP